MKLSEKMTAKAGRIRGHYLGTTHASELLLEYAPEVAKLEEKHAGLLGTLHEIVGTFHLGGTVNEVARLASNAINKEERDG